MNTPAPRRGPGQTEFVAMMALMMSLVALSIDAMLPALDLIAAGTDIDYIGATAVELIGPGESAGNYREIEIGDGKINTVKFR